MIFFSVWNHKQKEMWYQCFNVSTTFIDSEVEGNWKFQHETRKSTQILNKEWQIVMLKQNSIFSVILSTKWMNAILSCWNETKWICFQQYGKEHAMTKHEFKCHFIIIKFCDIVRQFLIIVSLNWTKTKKKPRRKYRNIKYFRQKQEKRNDCSSLNSIHKIIENKVSID